MFFFSAVRMCLVRLGCDSLCRLGVGGKGGCFSMVVMIGGRAKKLTEVWAVKIDKLLFVVCLVCCFVLCCVVLFGLFCVVLFVCLCVCVLLCCVVCFFWAGVKDYLVTRGLWFGYFISHEIRFPLIVKQTGISWNVAVGVFFSLFTCWITYAPHKAV